MAELRFEWHPQKAAANLRKHGVAFEEAASVFTDERALLIADPDHSVSEDRFILLGVSGAVRSDSWSSSTVIGRMPTAFD